MALGSFLEYILSNENYSRAISEIKDNFFNFLKECFICDLIKYYNETQKIVEVSSNDIIITYYNILLKNQEKLHPNMREIIPSNNQERFRICVRNTFTSNSSNKDGLQNRAELSYKYENHPTRKKQYTILYRLSDEFLFFDFDKVEYKKIIYNEKFPYMFNFRKFFISDNVTCQCGEDKNIFMNIKQNRKNHIPLPISGDFEYLCSKCFLLKNLKGIKKIHNRGE